MKEHHILGNGFLQQSSVASQWNPQQITCQQSYGSTYTYFDSTTCLQPDLSTSIVYSSQSRPSQIRQKNILPIRDPASKEIINLGDEQSSPSSSSNKSSSIDSTLKLPIASKHTSNIPLKFVENTNFSKNIEQECHQESEHSTSILPTTFDNQSLSINSDLSESHFSNVSENKEQLKDEVDNIQYGEELVATPVKETDIEDGTNLSNSLKPHEQSDIESTTTVNKSSWILTDTSSGNSGILRTRFDTIPQTLESKLVKRDYELY
ncbi:unnamed protein product [Rotaria sordida]|uniref:Uncharacterized protein n=2 Tax=Rotaria sordida TaxID=392033 RepID=A0A815CBA3_9BILA|nr:unnamed protein product [Rotaria sordida]